MAQNDYTVMLNEEIQTVNGTLITISESEEYIDTPINLYKVSDKNMALLGDIVKDLVINIHDITALVDMVLTSAFSVAADVNEDNSVNINDITNEVDFALGTAQPKQYVESYIVDDITDVWIKNSTAAAVDQH